MKRHIKNTDDETQWHAVDFPPHTVKNILNGILARIDVEKNRQLPGGPVRRLYNILSSRRRDYGSKEIPISREEIQELLCISPITFNKSVKSYFEELQKARIIDGYCTKRIGDKSYYVFSMVVDDILALTSIKDAAIQYFKTLNKLAESDSSLRKTVHDGNKCDLTEAKLAELLEECPQIIEHDRRDYYKVCLWADMLICSQAKNGNIRSITSVLKNNIEAGETPDLRNFVYEGYLDRLFKKNATAKVVEKYKVDVATSKEIDSSLERKVTDVLSRLKRDGKIAKFSEDAFTRVFGNVRAFGKTDASLALAASLVIRHAVKHAIATHDLHDMLRFYESTAPNNLDTAIDVTSNRLDV